MSYQWRIWVAFVASGVSVGITMVRVAKLERRASRLERQVAKLEQIIENDGR